MSKQSYNDSRKAKSLQTAIDIFMSLPADEYELIHLEYTKGITFLHKPCQTVVTKSIGHFNSLAQRGCVGCSRECQKIRSQKTFMKKYGVDNPAKYKEVIEKTKSTNRIRYGGNSPSSDKAVYEKQKNTLIKKFGVSNSFQINAVRAKCHSADSLLKKYHTHKKNKTFNTSRDEDVYFKKILNTFPDAIKQYAQDARYPFACDFYIPDLDVFIELNVHWTHGGSPFDSSNIEHQMQLAEWKEKAKKSKFYQNAIQVWTQRDVEKRMIAQKNDICLIEIFDRQYRVPKERL